MSFHKPVRNFTNGKITETVDWADPHFDFIGLQSANEELHKPVVFNVMNHLSLENKLKVFAFMFSLIVLPSLIVFGYSLYKDYKRRKAIRLEEMNKEDEEQHRYFFPRNARY